MKGVYWRPKNVSANVLLLVALVAVAGIASVELLKVKVKQKYYRDKMRAAETMASAMAEVKEFRKRLNIPIDKENDPLESGLVGYPISPVTSNTGYLNAKQTTINPNFAAVAVHLLKQAGVEQGDVVAVGLSGSFPALNLAVLSACDALGLEPVVISSASGSEWGANIPGFTWLEIESHLFEQKFFRFRSAAASLGGVGDKGQGMPPEGRKLLKEVIQRAGAELIWPASIDESLSARLAVYEKVAGDRPIKAYVNVGGGTVSVGTEYGKRLFKPGLNRTLPPGAADLPSVMVKFAAQGIPVIHFTKVAKLAEKFGLPAPPKQMQPVGQGNVFYKIEYNLWLTAGMLALVLASLWLLVRMNLASRLTGRPPKKDAGSPEPMV